MARGTGPGGQHRNKKDTAIQLKHIPTGIIVKSENERSQAQNRAVAWETLQLKLELLEREKAHNESNMSRKGQIGSGMRGDKRRTIRMQDDQVVDHVLGKKMKASQYLKGRLEKFYK